ncbi:2-keto-3-deoxygluconate permease [Hutsoniella sourekii]|uniref:2-keto-3-deoxygluconate permease n=1 Tax=Hutsoniella sourekii TaxID=87650 RepID=UPI00048779C4|nr:2-keto-3-deoxygluconate permease [Hutsoniella sourekii]
MYKFMKKFPGGLLLVPMLVAAVVNTLAPNFFANLGGVSEALFTTKGINYVVGATCFCSGATLNVRSLGNILKKQGTMILVKTLICVVAGFLYIKFFGQSGILGISAIAFVTVLCSSNPSLYLALEQDYGTPEDVSAFGLMGLICVPAYPMLVFSVAQSSPIDWTPIISTLIPIIFGMVVGNLDKDMAEFFKPGVVVLTPFMGWAFGVGINLIEAVQAGFQGIVITAMFYIFLLPALYLFERRVLKMDGITSIAMTSVAGMSVSVPSLVAATNSAVEPYVSSAVAQIAFAVVLTSIITPILEKRLDLSNHPEHAA